MSVKRISALLCIAVCLLLTSCGKRTSSIYVVCKETSECKYCYNQLGNFIVCKKDGTKVPYYKTDLKCYPALVVSPSKGKYSFRYVLPGLYAGTLESFNNYLGVLEDECTIDVISRDWNSIELFAHSESYSVRMLFNMNGELRIYAINNSDNSITAPYLLEEG